MSSAIVVIVVILLLIFLAKLLFKNNDSLEGGLATDYSGYKAYIVDVLMDAVYESYPNITVANVNEKLIDKVNPEDGLVIQKFIREIVYGLVSGGELAKSQLNESFPALIEAMVSLYYDKDCFIHDIKFYNGGTYNVIIEVICERVGDKYASLDIPNKYKAIIRTFRCRYNYLPNRTRTTKSLIIHTLRQLKETYDALFMTGRVYKPIYGSLYIPRHKPIELTSEDSSPKSSDIGDSISSTSEEQPMSLIWHLYPKFNDLDMPLHTYQIIDYMKCARDLAITLHQHGLVYGDWKMSNFMSYQDRIILTDVEMTKISDVVKSNWLAISHGVPFNIRTLDLDDETVKKIDNYVVVKDLACVLKSKALTEEELQKIVSRFPGAKDHPYRAAYNILVSHKQMPTMTRFGLDLTKHGIDVFDDKTTYALINHMIKLLTRC